MISKTSSANAVNFAKSLCDQSITLTPKHLSLLSTLTTSHRRSFNSESELKGFSLNPEHYLEMQSSGAITNNTYMMSDHDSYMENYVQDLSVAFSGYISFARNVVNKHVKMFDEKLTTYLNNFTHKNPEDFFNVSYYRLPEIFNSSIIDEVKQTPSGKEFIYMPIDKVNKDDLVLSEYLLYGDEELDLCVREFISSITEPVAFSYLTGNFNEYDLKLTDRLNYSLVNYLFYKNLGDKKDINFGYSTLQLTTKAYTNRRYFAHLLRDALSSYQYSIVKNGEVATYSSTDVFSIYNSKTFDVMIYEDNFEKAAEDGVTIDTIFGYITSIQSNSWDKPTIKNLTDGKDSYVANWSRVKNLYLYQLNTNRLSTFRLAAMEIYNEVSNIIAKEIEGDSDFTFDRKAFDFGHNEKAKKYIDSIDTESVNDISKISLDLIAKIRFSYSNAYEILHEMTSIMRSNPNTDPSEAALFSCVKYLISFLMDQVNVTKT